MGEQEEQGRQGRQGSKGAGEQGRVVVQVLSPVPSAPLPLCPSAPPLRLFCPMPNAQYPMPYY